MWKNCAPPFFFINTSNAPGRQETIKVTVSGRSSGSFTDSLLSPSWKKTASLENTIQEIRTTPIPVNIQLSYPTIPVAEKEVIQDEPVVVEETQENEVEEVPTVETPVVEEVVTPITLDSTFDGLDSTEKAALVKTEMKNADKVTAADIDLDLLEDRKKAKRASKKLKKLEKKREKIQKIRDKNDVRIYKKNKRRKFVRIIIVLILLALLLFAAVLCACVLIDYNKLPAEVAANIDKHLQHIPPFSKDGAIRVFARETALKIKQGLDGLLAGFKK